MRRKDILLTENIPTHVKQSAKRRKYRKNAGHSCSRCGAKHTRNGQRYCTLCHASYMRGWRKDHPLTAEQQKKDRCRSYANVYLSRGKLHRARCESCGRVRSQMHHADYSKPLDVKWFCRKCHLALHKAENSRAFSELVRKIQERMGL